MKLSLSNQSSTEQNKYGRNEEQIGQNSET